MAKKQKRVIHELIPDLEVLDGYIAAKVEARVKRAVENLLMELSLPVRGLVECSRAILADAINKAHARGERMADWPRRRDAIKWLEAHNHLYHFGEHEQIERFATAVVAWSKGRWTTSTD